MLRGCYGALALVELVLKPVDRHLSLAQPPVERVVLPNGITVIAVENNAADIVAARLFWRAGSCWEGPEQAGLSHLVATMLTKGTTERSAVAIADCVESVGASLGTEAASDYFMIGLKTVGADFASLLHLVGELSRCPSFPADEVTLEQHLTLQNLRAQQERPFSVAYNQLRAAMYPDHPYGRPVLGTEATIAALDREDLVAYHQQHFRPDTLVVSITGCLTPAAALALVEAVFGDWPAPALLPPTPQLVPLVASPRRCQTAQETQQAVVMLGYLTPPACHEDYAVLKLLNTYLGNGLSSRLFVELREKRGLAYDVSAFYPTRRDTSQFAAYLGTAPENTGVAIASLQREMQRLWEVELPAEELQAAKNKVLGQYALGKQTNAEIAHLYGWYEAIEVGLEFDQQFQAAVTRVTPAQAQAAAQRYFSDSPYISLVGPAATLATLG